MNLVGVYRVTNHTDVHLVELYFDKSPQKVDVGSITQEISGEPQANWQVPWSEMYLDKNGERIIGDWFNAPIKFNYTRLLFYFHQLNLSKPLLTGDGPLVLNDPTELPSRLLGKLQYDRLD
jgi:hypothetical protein